MSLAKLDHEDVLGAREGHGKAPTRRELLMAGVAALVASGASLLAPAPAYAVVQPLNLDVANNGGSGTTSITATTVGVDAATFKVSQAGIGPALEIAITNPASTESALYATAASTGQSAAVVAEVTNAGNYGAAIVGLTQGTGNGVFAEIQNVDSSGSAVLAVTNGMGAAVEGDGGDSGYGVRASGGRAPICLGVGPVAGAPMDPYHNYGEIWVDAAGVLYKVVTEGQPADEGIVEKPPVWVPLRSTVPLDAPVRVIDTRSGVGGVKGPLVSGKVYNFKNILGTRGIPAKAVGLVGNLTMVAATGRLDGLAWMAILPATKAAGTTMTPSTSTVNAPYNCLAVANQFTVGVGKGAYAGQISIVTNARIGLNAVVDITAYIA